MPGPASSGPGKVEIFGPWLLHRLTSPPCAISHSARDGGVVLLLVCFCLCVCVYIIYTMPNVLPGFFLSLIPLPTPPFSLSFFWKLKPTV